jgi:hypothetical protein
MAQDAKLPPITAEAMKSAMPIDQGGLPPIPQPNLKTGEGMEFPYTPPPVPKMGKSVMGRAYGPLAATGNVLKQAAPAVAAIGATAADPFTAPVTAPAAYFATKGMLAPKDIAEHPIRETAIASSMGMPLPTMQGAKAAGRAVLGAAGRNPELARILGGVAGAAAGYGARSTLGELGEFGGPWVGYRAGGELARLGEKHLAATTAERDALGAALTELQQGREQALEQGRKLLERYGSEAERPSEKEISAALDQLEKYGSDVGRPEESTLAGTIEAGGRLLERHGSEMGRPWEGGVASPAAQREVAQAQEVQRVSAGLRNALGQRALAEREAARAVRTPEEFRATERMGKSQEAVAQMNKPAARARGMIHSGRGPTAPRLSNAEIERLF